jgi:hypothetical protein
VIIVTDKEGPGLLEESNSPNANSAEAYLGVDVGSVSTNVVALDRDGAVLCRKASARSAAGWGPASRYSGPGRPGARGISPGWSSAPTS